MPTSKLLTGVELELMQLLWDFPSSTVKEVQDRLAPKRKLAYTSVATILKILERKGVLAIEKKDRAFVYRPLVSRSEYESRSLVHMVSNVFRGEHSLLAMRLITECQFSPDELQSLRTLLEERLGG